jgi:hypothetical protein
VIEPTVDLAESYWALHGLRRCVNVIVHTVNNAGKPTLSCASGTALRHIRFRLPENPPFKAAQIEGFSMQPILRDYSYLTGLLPTFRCLLWIAH